MQFNDISGCNKDHDDSKPDQDVEGDQDNEEECENSESAATTTSESYDDSDEETSEEDKQFGFLKIIDDKSRAQEELNAQLIIMNKNLNAINTTILSIGTVCFFGVVAVLASQLSHILG